MATQDWILSPATKSALESFAWQLSFFKQAVRGTGGPQRVLL